MKHLSKNNKVIVLKKKAHRPNSDGNNDTHAPTWFKSWYKEFEKKNDQRWEKQEQFNQMLVERLDNIVKLNNLKE